MVETIYLGHFLGNQRRKKGCLLRLLADLSVVAVHKELEFQKTRESSLEPGRSEASQQEGSSEPMMIFCGHFCTLAWLANPPTSACCFLPAASPCAMQAENGCIRHSTLLSYSPKSCTTPPQRGETNAGFLHKRQLSERGQLFGHRRQMVSFQVSEREVQSGSPGKGTAC